MAKNMRNRAGRTTSFLLACCFLIPVPAPVSAQTAREVGYMPGVTEEMTEPAYWSGLAEYPNALLASPEEIAQINEEAVATEGSNRRDMRKLRETYNGIERNEALKKAAG